MEQEHNHQQQQQQQPNSRSRLRQHQQPLYGQAVVGPPGSGKTTFCDGMQQYLTILGREACVINLDPANEGIITTKQQQQNNGTMDSDSSGTKSTPTTTTSTTATNKNPFLPYNNILYDICEEVINVTSVMEQTKLGPNGGLLYCMEYIEAHIDSIVQTIEERIRTLKQLPYILIDLPGQVELYTHSTCVQTILSKLSRTLDIRFTLVQLIDSLYCTDPSKFISAALLGTTTMIRLELPTVNVLSKMDLLTTSYNHSTNNDDGNSTNLPYELDFYTDCCDLERLIPLLLEPQQQSNNEDDRYSDKYDDDDCYYYNDPDYQAIRTKRYNTSFHKKFTKLHQVMAEVVNDFSLVSFVPLDINDAESVGRVLSKIDKCNGYVYIESSTTTQSTATSTTANHYGKLFQSAKASSTRQY